jgi:Raf kinase inhibitor-like YbhB/YbcL family protein
VRIASTSFAEGGAMPPRHAFCAPDARTHATLSQNVSPQLSWSDVPAGTKSFAIICHDPDVPSKGDDVNREGRVVPRSLLRVDFFHWVLVDLPAEVTSAAEGEFSSSVTPRGKTGPAAPHNSRQGVNDYTGWFASDAEMSGEYRGYDGPCPPWNDELPHRYVFTVFALDVAKLMVDGSFGGADVRKAMQGHILSQASITGRYTLNPSVKLSA